MKLSSTDTTMNTRRNKRTDLGGALWRPTFENRLTQAVIELITDWNLNPSPCQTANALKCRVCPRDTGLRVGIDS